MNTNKIGFLLEMLSCQKAEMKDYKDLESILDTKFYHDPYYMNTIIGSFNDLEKEKKELASDMNLSVAVEQKDANTWNSATTSMPLFEGSYKWLMQ